MDSKNTLQNSTLLVTTVTAFMAPFMLSSINVALPDIQADLGGDAILLGWIATSYLLATAVILVPVGRFADMYGRKKIFLWGIVVYTVGSLLSILVPDMFWLLATRTFQGVGAAMFITTGMAILTSVFPPEKRGKGIGILVTSVYIGLASGPFVGGFLTRFFGWRSIFMLMVALGILSLYVTLRHLKGEWADAREEKFDLPGSLLYAISISILVYGLTQILQTAGAVMTVAGSFGLILFFHQQKRKLHPLIEVNLFQENHTFLFSSLAALIHYAATFAVTFQISLYLQYIRGLEPQTAGTVLMVQPVMMALFSTQAGKLSDRIEPRVIASVGMSITSFGLLILVFLSETTALWQVVMTMALLGFGFALFSSPNMSAIMGSVQPNQYGLASGTVATMRLLGQMGSMAIATFFLGIHLGRQEIQYQTFSLFQSSMKSCFVFFVILCTIGIAFSFFRGNIRKEGA